MFWKFVSAEGLGGRAWVVHAFQPGARPDEYILLRKKKRSLPMASVWIFELYVQIENLCGLRCHTKQGFAIWDVQENNNRELRFTTIHPSHSDLPEVGFVGEVGDAPVATTTRTAISPPLRLPLDRLVDMYDYGLPTTKTMHNDAYAMVKFPYYFMNGHMLYGPCFYQTRRRRPGLPVATIRHAAKLLRPQDPFFACQLPAIALRYGEDLQIMNGKLVPWDSFDPSSVYNVVDCDEKGKVIAQVHGALVDADKQSELANYFMMIALVRTGEPRTGRGGQSHIMTMAIPKVMLHANGLQSAEGMVLMDTIHFSTQSKPPTKDIVERAEEWQPLTPDGQYECGNIGALQYYFHNCNYYKQTVLLRLFMFGDTPHDIYSLTPITHEHGKMVQGVCLNDLFGPSPDEHIALWAAQRTTSIPEWRQMVQIGETFAHPEVSPKIPPLLQKTPTTELKSFFIASDPDKYDARKVAELLGHQPLETLVSLDDRGYSSIVFAQ